jgi:hypothetical protein
MKLWQKGLAVLAASCTVGFFFLAVDVGPRVEYAPDPLPVAVEAPQHSGLTGALHYSSPQALPPGTLLRVPLGKRDLLGIVWHAAPPAAGFVVPAPPSRRSRSHAPMLARRASSQRCTRRGSGRSRWRGVGAVGSTPFRARLSSSRARPWRSASRAARSRARRVRALGGGDRGRACGV